MVLWLSLFPASASDFTILYQQEFDSLPLIQGNSLIAFVRQETEIGPIKIKKELEKELGTTEDRKKKIKELIKCLIRFESNWNENAVGDNGDSLGILQFKRETFDYFSKKYNLDLEIWEAKDQILLADLMIRDGLIFHWTTAKYCL